MPEVNVYPDASGYIQEWSWQTGGTWADLADDADGDYIKTALNNKLSFWSMAPLSDYVAAASINDIDIRWRVRNNTGFGACGSYGGIRLSGSNTYTALDQSSGWAWTRKDVTRPGGGNWLTSDLDTNIEVGVKSYSLGGITQCTELRYVADYNPPDGGFSFLIAKWLLPIIAAASHSLMFREVNEILVRANMNPVPSNVEDFRRILEAFRVRPVRLCLQ